VQAWSAKSGIPMGASFPVSALWKLAQLWFHDRLSPTWRRRTIDEAHAVFTQAGLTGAFWTLDG